ncbi:retrovirus-related pol polyprotein from transposon TNT 1-94 [Tanacetum coccineum]
MSLLTGRKPNVEYFHVFGSLCYPTNDRDDLGKIKPKADIGIFIGYSKTSRGFRIYNRCTKKITKTIHVKFDKLIAMAFEHDCLEPELQRFINHNSSAETINTPSKEDLDNLFGPMYEEYFEKKFSDTPINSAAQPTQIHEDSPSTSSIIVDEHEAPPIVTTSDEQTSPISLTEADEFNQEDSANFDGNSQFVPYNPPSHEEIESSTMALEHYIVQKFSTKYNLKLTLRQKTPLANYWDTIQTYHDFTQCYTQILRISVMLKILWFETKLVLWQKDTGEKAFDLKKFSCSCAPSEAVRMFMLYAGSVRISLSFQMMLKRLFFLNGLWNIEVYVSQPEGFIDPEFHIITSTG